MDKMARLWRFVTDLLMSLTGRDAQDIVKRKLLREIHLDLRKRNPPLYRANRNEILPGFARTLFAFHQALLPIREIIAKSVDHDDAKFRQRFWDSLIDSRLPNRELQRKRSFSLEEMRRTVSGSSEPSKEIERISRDFHQFKALFSSEGFRTTDSDLRILRRLVAVSRFQYLHLLMLFDEDILTSDPSRKPEFRAVSGERALTDMQDLVFVLNGLSFDPILEHQLGFLAERVGGSAKSAGKRIGASLGRMEKLFRSQLSPFTLISLIRAIQENPSYLPETSREEEGFIGPYVERLDREFQRCREQLLREQHDSVVEQELDALFGKKADLLELQAYNDAENRLLADAGHATFSYVKPLRILRSFLVAKFERDLKDVLQRIMIEGLFESRNYQGGFSAAYYAVEHCSERIRQFDEGLLGQGRISIANIRKLMKLTSQGKQLGDRVDKMVEAVDAMAAEITEQETNRIFELGRYILEIAGDFKAKAPQNVMNIRTIGGAANREIITCLVDRYNDIVRLMRVMKNFTVIKPRRSVPASP